MRVLADVSSDGGVKLQSRNGNDVTVAYPELVALGALGRDALFDGEIVALDDAGLPSFERLMERMSVQNPGRARSLAARVPVTYIIFDLLRMDGEATVALPYRERRARLDGLELPVGPWQVPGTFADGDALAAATAERGLEGVVAKRLDAPYRPGRRSADWVKLSHRVTTDSVVLGWRARGGSVVSVAVGTVDRAGEVRFAGTVGSGISQGVGRELLATLRSAAHGEGADRDDVQIIGLDPAEQAAFTAEGFRWTRPDLVVEVRHLGIGSAGRFRQPVFDRVRTDVRAADLGVGGRGGAPVGKPAGMPQRTRGKPAADEAPVSVTVGGRVLQVSHLSKVLYPAKGTTKAEVLTYITAAAPFLLALAAGRPLTRRRWPEGVAEQSFFEKNLPTWAPEWIDRVTIPTSDGSITYPLLQADDTASLVWLAAHSALELHTPQWRVGADGSPASPDRIVIDLDPGPGVGLPECCEVALMARDELAIDGLAAHPVLSGSKGLHIYAPLPEREPTTSDEVTERAHRLAVRMAQQRPGLVVTTMTKALRRGRVFVDWSQNRAAKTTIAPWSLRGTTEPFVAAPVSWDEVASGGLTQLRAAEVLQRLQEGVQPTPW